MVIAMPCVVCACAAEQLQPDLQHGRKLRYQRVVPRWRGDPFAAV